MTTLKQSDLKVGDRVRYQPEHYGEGRWENGVVKKIPDYDIHSVFVVYDCDDNWLEYSDYYAKSTRLIDLKDGWRQGRQKSKES